MDVVKAFNNELSGLYEVKPPISKAKMTSITRTAIKAIKFYKHVVQSVEKFILKCKPEYKVPGLYVIDSIVRQSRHQFGPDKDVFAPRFAKNMQLTFSNLFSCPPEEKGKIIRVLNLWQKNQVFNPDVIQPLFDQLADPNNPIHREPSSNSNGVSVIDKTPPQPHQKSFGSVQGTPSGAKSNSASMDTSLPNWVKVAQTQMDAASKAFVELSAATVHLGQQKNTAAGVDLLQQLQQLQQLILNQTPQKQERNDQVLFDKKLLEFDYGDDDDENTSPHHQMAPSNDNINNILQNPDILRSLTAIQQHMSQAQLKQQQLEEEKMRKLKEMKQQEEEFDKHLAQTVPKLPFAAECDLKQFSDVGGMSGMARGFGGDGGDSEVELIDDDGREGRNVEVITVDRSPSSPGDGSRRSSRSPSRGRRRRRSRSDSGSRSRSDRRRRHRSRSRSRQRHRERDRDREMESAKEKERRKKGLPPIKKNHLSVCSTTLWIGHLSKLVQQEDLSDTFGGFGDIISINLIPPRGCAFVCMNRRQDASRALIRLNNHKLHGKVITLAWAPGKGVKGRDFKDFWEVDLGVSYIPWNLLKTDTNFVELEEGGHLDEDTMPENLKPIILEQIKKSKNGKEKQPDADLAGISFPVAVDGVSSPGPLLGVMPGMNVPPPGHPPVPAATPNIDTSQPPPGLPPPTVAMTQMPPGIPLLPKAGLIMPPFPFANLPPPLGMPVPNIMGNLPIGVPPPNLPGLMIPQQMLHPPMMPPMPNTPQETVPADPGRQPHPLEGRPLTNSKDDDVMDVDSDETKNREKRDWGRSRNDDRRDGDEKKDGKDRDDRKERDRDRDRRERDRDRDRGRDKRRDSRDRRDRGRDARDGRSRNRSRSRDRDSRNRSRDRRNRSPDRDKSKSRRGEERSEGSLSNDKKQLSPWVEVPVSSANSASEKPTLQQRLRSIAEGRTVDAQEDAPHDERQGPPIVINLNNPAPRPLFGPRGPVGAEFSPRGPPPFNISRPVRPPFGGPFNDIGPRMNYEDMGSGPRPSFDEIPPGGPGFEEMPGDGPMLYDGEGPVFDGPRGFDPRRGRFDGPVPLMRRPFDEPPVDLMMMGPPGPMFLNDFPHPGGPRIRFSPRGPMGPMLRGMGPGPGPLFGPRGPRPLIPRQLGPWVDGQGPVLNDRPRPPFDARERNISGRKRERDGPRTSRWSKEEEHTENTTQIEEPNNGLQENAESTNAANNEANEVPAVPTTADADVHTPVYDEPQIEEHHKSPIVQSDPIEPTNESTVSLDATGSSTPCHDEPPEATQALEE